MIQAARSGKQNIVEGVADGVVSVDMKVSLLNVARASIKELREDYLDYLNSRHLVLWNKNHPRYDALLLFCRTHNKEEDYLPFFNQWTDEEFANCANTLCHMVDKMLATHIAANVRDFTENGSLKERMMASRRSHRNTQNEEIAALKSEISRLLCENASLRRELAIAQGEPSPVLPISSIMSRSSSPSTQSSPSSQSRKH